jgi:hypothetical protein
MFETFGLADVDLRCETVVAGEDWRTHGGRQGRIEEDLAADDHERAKPLGIVARPSNTVDLAAVHDLIADRATGIGRSAAGGCEPAIIRCRGLSGTPARHAPLRLAGPRGD